MSDDVRNRHDADGTALVVGASFLLAMALPFVFGSPYPIHVATLILLYVIMAMGLSIVVGYAGLLDVGYVAFFAVGAYFYAIFNVRLGISIGIALPSAAVLAALAGVILGFPTLRVRGDYLALVTLAFGEMVRQVLQNWTSMTNGPKGIPGISGPSLFGMKATLPTHYYYVVLGCAALALLVLRKTADSPAARVWSAIRDEETAARSSGLDSTRWLLLAFAVGASFAGVAGVLFASIQGFVSPETFVLDESILILAIVVLAGGRSLPRILLGAFVLCGVPELMRSFQQYRTLLFGGLLVGFTVLDHYFGKRALLRDSGAASGPTTGDEPADTYPDTLKPKRPVVSRIVVADVHKSFNGLKALDGVSFEHDCAGTVIGLVGANGAGKTTLFNCISGLETVTSGTITAEGIGKTTNRAAYDLAHSGIARTFQTVRLFKSMTVRENVQVGAYCGLHIPIAASFVPLVGASTFNAQVEARVTAALEMTGTFSLADRPVSTLPIGLQRKVEVARALATRPRLLLLDEIASGLNDGEKKSLAGLLRTISSQGGIPILLVEHDMAFVTSVASHLVVLDAGTVLAEGDPSDVVQDAQVIAAYLGTPEVQHA